MKPLDKPTGTMTGRVALAKIKALKRKQWLLTLKLVFWVAVLGFQLTMLYVYGFSLYPTCN